jgi:hypothetical protein
MGPVSNNLLNRLPDSPSLTPIQAQVDGLVGNFARQMTDWKSLSALAAGGMAYRLGRAGVMASGLTVAVRPLSVAIGLGAEVAAFEAAHRSLQSLTGEGRGNPHLWRWDGPGGLRQGLLSSLITFGSLKGVGRLVQGENLLVQHLSQNLGMVLAHNVSGSLGSTHRPTGSLSEQFLHAEATLLQLGAGMALGHALTAGRIHALEQGLDLSLKTMETNEGNRFPWSNIPFSMQPAFAGASGRILRSQGSEEALNGPTILKMSRLEGERLSDEDIDFETLSEKAETDPEALDFLRILAEANHEFAIFALVTAAQRNPKAVFTLLDLARNGNDLVKSNLRQLDISQLLQLARQDPEAAWAIRYLAELKNEEAVTLMNGWESSLFHFLIHLDSSLFPASSFRIPLPFQRERWEQMAQEAETDPKIVSFLKKLADEGNSRAEGILINLNIQNLVAQAEYDLPSLYVLCELAVVGNPWAVKVLRYWDVSLLFEEAQKEPTAMTAMAIIAQTGNEDALSLFYFLDKKARGEPSN